MTDDANDDPENDPLLRSMRSVWLGMRDEEPPQRGLAELMAAAREQATLMKPPEKKESWWRKSLALLVRPPVLAAATVLVVVGGAVALNRRGAEAPAPVAESEQRAKPAAKQEQDPPRDLANKELKAEEAAPAAGSAAASADDRASRTAPTAASQFQPRPPTVDKPKIVDEPTVKVAPPPPPPPPPPAGPQGGEGGMVIANEAPIVEGTKSVKTPSVVTTPKPEPARLDDAEAGVGGSTVDRAPSPGRTPTVSTDQLVKQAETAASRNDCAAVKVTADRVKKMDPSAYKTRLATQPRIARCLK